jgi:hypothetical protein
MDLSRPYPTNPPLMRHLAGDKPISANLYPNDGYVCLSILNAPGSGGADWDSRMNLDAIAIAIQAISLQRDPLLTEPGNQLNSDRDRAYNRDLQAVTAYNAILATCETIESAHEDCPIPSLFEFFLSHVSDYLEKLQELLPRDGEILSGFPMHHGYRTRINIQQALDCLEASQDRAIGYLRSVGKSAPTDPIRVMSLRQMSKARPKPEKVKRTKLEIIASLVEMGLRQLRRVESRKHSDLTKDVLWDRVDKIFQGYNGNKMILVRVAILLLEELEDMPNDWFRNCVLKIMASFTFEELELIDDLSRKGDTNRRDLIRTLHGIMPPDKVMDPDLRRRLVRLAIKCKKNIE